MNKQKLWGGKVRKIKITNRTTNRVESEFLADDVQSTSPINRFYLNGEEVNYCDERKSYFTSEEREN